MDLPDRERVAETVEVRESRPGGEAVAGNAMDACPRLIAYEHAGARASQQLCADHVSHHEVHAGAHHVTDG